MKKKVEITPDELENLAATMRPPEVWAKLGVSSAWLPGRRYKSPELFEAYNRGRARFLETGTPEPVEYVAPEPEQLPAAESILTAINGGCKTLKEIYNVIGGDLRLIYKQLGNLVSDGKLKKVNETFCRPEDVWEDPEQETFASMKRRVVESLKEYRYQSTGQIFHHTAIPFGVVSTILDELFESGDVQKRDVGEVAVWFLGEFATEKPLYNTGHQEFAVREDEPEPTPKAGAAVSHKLAFAAAAAGDYIAATKPEIPVTAEEDEAFNMLPATDPAEESDVRASVIIHAVDEQPEIDKETGEVDTSKYTDTAAKIALMLMGKRIATEIVGNEVEAKIGQLEVSPAATPSAELAEHFPFNVGKAIELIWTPEPRIDDLELAQMYLEREVSRRRRAEG